MSQRSLHRVVRHMCVLAGHKREEMSDEMLIERFTRHQDESAFASLVRRHGPMVRSVCQRELRNEHEAEDAFQATFLVLARKASTLRQRERVASWLHGVAFRIARRAKILWARRATMPLDPHQVPERESMSDLAWRELRLVLDEEIGRLPVKYREPIVRCYLEGMSYNAAAAIMGVPAGTVSGRLDRARDLLRSRLVRRGLTLCGGLLGTLLAEKSIAAPLPHSLVERTLEGSLAFSGKGIGGISGKAVFLADATLRSLFVAKCKAGLITILVCAAILVGGYWVSEFLQPSRAGGAGPKGRDDKNHGRESPGPGGPTEAQQIVARAIEGMGGANQAAKLDAIGWTAVWNLGEPNERTQKFSAQGMDRFRMELTQQKDGKPEELVYVINQNEGWRLDPRGGVGTFSAAMLAQNRERFYVLRLGDLLTQFDPAKLKWTPMNDTVLDKRPVVSLKVEQVGWPTVQLYFDKASGLLYRSEAIVSPSGQGADVKLSYTFEEYKEFDGLMRFTRLRMKQGDETEAVAHIRDFRVLGKADRRVFDKP